MEKLPKKSYPYGIIIPYILPILAFYFLPKELKSFLPIIISVLLLIAIVISYFAIKKFKKDPYPFCWLVDIDTLIQYIKED